MLWVRIVRMPLSTRSPSASYGLWVDQIDVGAGVFLFAGAVSLGTGLLFGLLPAWNVTRADLQGALKEGDRGTSGSRRMHTGLVVLEVALSIVLLAGAFLMVQSFVRLQQRQLGFDAERVLSARLMLPAYRYGDEPRRAAFTRSLIERLRTIPGVESVGVTNYLPLSGWWGVRSFVVEGRPLPAPGQEPTADYRNASEDYFTSIGIRLIAGRAFTSHDDTTGQNVIIVNDTLAKRYWPGEDPIGRRIFMGEGRTASRSKSSVWLPT
jgi:putative ABC transport system permease protein